ncbi:MAG: phosphoribosylamine--glycine ligase [Coriobacteriales bacterium]|nr:phosphoribosylamine--glycine ligase [Coriobacteriales bacterium]
MHPYEAKESDVNILVLGSGGREHAISTFLAKSPLCERLFVAPGNGGTASIASNVSLDINDGAAVLAFAQANAIDMVVIGPEAPLVAGVADVLRDAGIDCFGPGAAGARLEGSKAFSKAFMLRHDLPTAAYASFGDKDAALAYVREQGAPLVVKADGLAAGKGVVVAQTLDEALAAVEDCFDGRFGAAGATVVIEEMLKGPECSLLAFTDGITMLPMAPAQDHKRAFDGDLGPNTGGMGVYSPVPIVTPQEHAAMCDVMQRTVDSLRAEGIDYRGCLYGGFMLTAQGPKLLEFNARFGDPETQVVLPRLKTDLVSVMLAVARQELAGIELEWRDDWAVSVVIASGGYPGSYPKGLPISGLDAAAALPGVTVFHAGTKLAADGTLLSNGGRVLNVTALGESFSAARDLAYQAVDLIHFDGCFFRHDIGGRALKGRSAWED